MLSHQLCADVYEYKYTVGGKRQINYKFIPTGLFCCFPLIRSIYTLHYSYVLSTVL